MSEEIYTALSKTEMNFCHSMSFFPFFLHLHVSELFPVFFPAKKCSVLFIPTCFAFHHLFIHPYIYTRITCRPTPNLIAVSKPVVFLSQH